MRAAPAGLLLAAALLGLSGCSREMVVLLPDDAGHVGRLSLISGDREVVLDEAYTAASPGDTAPSAVDQDEVQRRFGAALAAAPEPPASFTLYFEEGTTVLRAESRPEFERMLAEVAAREAPEVQVTGHTDRLGLMRDNDRLSARRAVKVRAALMDLGLTADSILAVGRGEREPLVPQPDETREPRNRRVEVTVR